MEPTPNFRFKVLTAGAGPSRTGNDNHAISSSIIARFARFLATLGCAAALLTAVASAAEPEPAWSALGPFLFSHPEPDGGRVAGFRPFYVRRTDLHGETAETTVLYPLFYYRRYGVTYEWSILKLINRVGRVGAATPAETAEVPRSEKTFAIWPFYFTRTSPDPAESYWGLLPLYGNVQGILSYSRISWVLFPLYVQTVKRASTTTSVPWPIIRSTKGFENGFAVWPVYGHVESPDGESRTYFLWPLCWKNTHPPKDDAPPGTAPSHEFGILPFYTSDRKPGLVSETYVWPFFGYTDRTAPDHYHETRYFWPFLVQAEGDDGRVVNRWGPFYTHSVDRGVDNTWVLWPLWHRRTWIESDAAMTKTQLLYFIYSSLEQRSVIRPGLAPALKRRVFPLFSYWDNGAGKQQFELLSPFEPIFADNPEVRDAWSPLFALVRHDQPAPGVEQNSLLWSEVTWTGSGDGGLSDFSLGPVFATRRGTDGGWRTSWFEFDSRN